MGNSAVGVPDHRHVAVDVDRHPDELTIVSVVVQRRAVGLPLRLPAMLLRHAPPAPAARHALDIDLTPVALRRRVRQPSSIGRHRRRLLVGAPPHERRRRAASQRPHPDVPARVLRLLLIQQRLSVVDDLVGHGGRVEARSAPARRQRRRLAQRPGRLRTTLRQVVQASRRQATRSARCRGPDDREMRTGVPRVDVDDPDVPSAGRLVDLLVRDARAVGRHAKVTQVACREIDQRRARPGRRRGASALRAHRRRTPRRPCRTPTAPICPSPYGSVTMPRARIARLADEPARATIEPTHGQRARLDVEDVRRPMRRHSRRDRGSARSGASGGSSTRPEVQRTPPVAALTAEYRMCAPPPTSVGHRSTVRTPGTCTRMTRGAAAGGSSINDDPFSTEYTRVPSGPLAPVDGRRADATNCGSPPDARTRHRDGAAEEVAPTVRRSRRTGCGRRAAAPAAPTCRRRARRRRSRPPDAYATRWPSREKATLSTSSPSGWMSKRTSAGGGWSGEPRAEPHAECDHACRERRAGQHPHAASADGRHGVACRR